MLLQHIGGAVAVFAPLLAILAAFTALDLAHHSAAARGWTRALWIAAGSVAMGFGIWTMHFTAMLSVHLPVPITYDPLVLVASVLVGVTASLPAFFLVHGGGDWSRRLQISALLMGLAIAGMHYTGMAAIQAPVVASYDAKLTAVALLIAVGMSYLGLRVGGPSGAPRAQQRGWLRMLLAGLILGTAVAGLHFTAMAGTRLDVVGIPSGAQDGVVATPMLISAILLCTILILCLTLGSTALDRRREERLRETLETITYGFLAVSRDWQVDYLNRGARELLGPGAATAMGRVFWEVVPDLAGDEHRSRLVGAMQRRTHEEIEAHFPSLDRWIQVDVFPTRHGLSLHLSDVTQRREAELALAASEQKYRSLVEHSYDGIVLFDRDGRVLEANQRLCEMLGCTVKEQLPALSRDFLAPDEQGASEQQFEELKRTRHLRLERNLSRLDGSVFPAEIGLTLLDQGRVQCTVRDITQRRETELALQQRERQLNEAQRIAHIGSWHWTFSGNIAGSEEMHRILALPAERGGFSFHEFLDRVHPDDREMVKAASQRVIDTGQPGDVEYRVVWPTGDVRILQSHADLGYAPDGTPSHMSGTAQDVTERKRAEQALRDSDRLSVAGKLAGGAAHFYNNIHTAILGNAQMLLLSDRLGEGNRDAAEQIVQASRRAAALTRQLLAAGQKQIAAPVQIDLRAAVEQGLRTVRDLLPPWVELVSALPEQPAPVRLDPGQLTQVLVELAGNALEAMGEHGVLSVELREITPGAPGASAPTYELAVRDNGCGIHPQLIPYIFEPFFTTRDRTSVPGLGLSMVNGIVKQNGGSITVESVPGQGALFRILLPGSPAAVEVSEAAGPKPRSTGGMVLLAEDEPSVRHIVRLTLQRRGFEVLEAGNGEEALQLYQRYAGKIDLLLTDIRMPRMSGPELLRALRRQDPGLRAVYLSGYPDDASKITGLASDGTPLLAKPFDLADLVDVVRTTLADRRVTAVPYVRH